MNIPRWYFWSKATVLVAVIACALAIPCCVSTPQAQEQIALAQADVRDFRAMLDPVADADALKVVDEIEKALGTLQAALDAGQGKESIDLILAQLDVVWAAYGDEGPKSRQVRLIVTALRIALRHIEPNGAQSP